MTWKKSSKYSSLAALGLVAAGVLAAAQVIERKMRHQVMQQVLRRKEIVNSNNSSQNPFIYERKWWVTGYEIELFIAIFRNSEQVCYQFEKTSGQDFPRTW